MNHFQGAIQIPYQGAAVAAPLAAATASRLRKTAKKNRLITEGHLYHRHLGGEGITSQQKKVSQNHTLKNTSS